MSSPKKKTLTRLVPCTLNEFKKVQRDAKAALNLASVHDPDIMKTLADLEMRISITERQLERLGAPQYRCVRKGTNPILVERVRGPKKGKPVNE